jgi:hypothetical protein
MWETMARQPIPSSTASPSPLPPDSAANPSPAAATADQDHLYGEIGMRRQLLDEAQTIEYCVFVLFGTARLSGQAPGVHDAPPPFGDGLGHEGGPDPPRPELGLVDLWLEELRAGLQRGIALDGVPLTVAIKQWDLWKASQAARGNAHDCPQSRALMRVVRAAEREGQGVIVHPRCTLA